eukprot:908987-Pyramimonas_sp.AAC.1
MLSCDSGRNRRMRRARPSRSAEHVTGAVDAGVKRRARSSRPAPAAHPPEPGATPCLGGKAYVWP